MRWIRALTVGAALAAAACGDGGGEKPGGGGGGGGGKSSGVIRIGVAGPITGAQAKNGKDLVDGTTMAVEEFNAAGGVLGMRIEVVTRDDEALAKNAPTVAQELIDAGVVGVVGHFNSHCTQPASDLYAKKSIVMITPASTNVFITDRKLPGIFRVCGRDDQQGRTAADHVVGVLGAKKVAVLDDRTTYGKGLADAFAASVGDRARIVVREGFSVDERNFRPYLAKVKDEGAEVWYFGGIYEQAVPLVNQAKQVGVTAPMMSGDGVHGYQAEFIDQLGPAADGVLTTFPNTEGVAGYADFMKRYEERFKTRAGPYAIYSFAAAKILIESIRDAGTTDGAKVAAAVRARPHDTPVGAVEFDEKGDVKATDYYSVWVLKGGKHVLAAPK
jgi:branched-chain amino acid transport system substrate-binding protein